MKEIEIYTDGSCHTQHLIGGWAAIILKADEEVMLQGYENNTTHNRMELLSVIKAFEYLIDQNLIDAKITLYSDSQYVVNLEIRKEKFIKGDYLTKSGKVIQNSDLVKQLLHYSEQLKPEFIKVKAHQKKGEVRNINREVDKLSRKIVRDQVKKLK